MTRDLLDGWSTDQDRATACRIGYGKQDFSYGVNDTEPFAAASLLKVPVALAVEAAFAAGTLDPELPVAVAEVRTDAPGALQLLDTAHPLSAAEIHGLALALSDNDCATWLFDLVGGEGVETVLRDLGCHGTVTEPAGRQGVGPLEGVTTAADALALVAAATDRRRFPRTSTALRHTLSASRIPLGAVDADIRIAHKTGSLTGVAHDAAVLEGAEGVLQIVFLSRNQHDTLVTGYQMGICTRGILEAWGLGVRRTVGLS